MTAEEILIEIQRVGKALRVTAMDVKTGTEVVFQVPATAGKAELKSLAVKKMAYVLNKRTKIARN